MQVNLEYSYELAKLSDKILSLFAVLIVSAKNASLLYTYLFPKMDIKS